MHRSIDPSCLLCRCIFQEYSQYILKILGSNSARENGGGIPKMGQLKGRLELDQVWSPLVQIHALRAHEIWPIYEDKIHVFYAFKDENEVSLPNEMDFDSFRNQQYLVYLHPQFNGFWRWP